MSATDIHPKLRLVASFPVPLPLKGVGLEPEPEPEPEEEPDDWPDWVLEVLGVGEADTVLPKGVVEVVDVPGAVLQQIVRQTALEYS